MQIEMNNPDIVADFEALDFEDMEEPTECPHCSETFDAALPENWVSIPFHLVCGHCRENIWPEHEVKWQER
jgi:hypothetical protein